MIRHSAILLCLAVAALVVVGLITLASTSVWVRGVEEPYFFLYKQSIMVGVGLVAAVVAGFVPPEFIRKHAVWAFVGCSILLALCYAPAPIGVEIYGSKRWVQIPGVGQFQPSELAKIITVVALAAWFARWQTEISTFWRGFVFPGAIAAVPILLIAGETDVGTALALSVATGAIFYVVGTRMAFVLPTAITVITGALIYILNNDNRRARIESWLDLEGTQLGAGRQQFRSLIAFGNGGPWGVGLGNGNEKFSNLTFAHIDFIFPVIGEELGLVTTLGVVLCYVLIAVAGVGIAVRAETFFNRCLALGLTTTIVVPAMVNIGVTTALLPNDGLPLPFVSFGGTSLVFSLAAVGMLVGIDRRTRERTVREFPLTRETRLAVKL